MCKVAGISEVAVDFIVKYSVSCSRNKWKLSVVLKTRNMKRSFGSCAAN